jgi:hypothetical protein
VVASLKVDSARITPEPPASRANGREVAHSALCVAIGPSRDGDGLGRLHYLVGNGVNWKPIAAALRSSDFSRFAFIFAS